MREIHRMPRPVKLAIESFAIAAGFALTATLLLLFVSDSSFFPEDDSLDDASINSQTGGLSEGSNPAAGSSETQVATEESIDPSEVHLVGIVPSPRIVNINGAGKSQQMSVQGLYSDGTIHSLQLDAEDQLTFTSSAAEIVEVDTSGLLTGIQVGGADIAVTYGEHSANVPVLIWGPARRIPPVAPNRLLELEKDGPVIVLNRVLVELDSGYHKKDADEIASAVGATIIFEFRTFPGFVIEFDADTAEALDEVLMTLNADPRVVSANPDSIIHTSQGAGQVRQVPYQVESIDSQGLAYDHAGFYDAWTVLNDNTLRLEPVIIAVIDVEFANIMPGEPGFNLIRDEFDGGQINYFNSRITPTPEFSSGRIHVTDLVPGNASAQHGTSVTSIIIASNNNPVNINGFSGAITSVADLEYELMFYGAGNSLGTMKHRETTTALNLINALEHVQPYSRQIDVVNMSFVHRCGKWILPDCPLQYLMAELIREMPRTTFVVGAGNSNLDIHEENIIPADFTVDRGFTGFRKALPNIITVGGVIGTIHGPLGTPGSIEKSRDSNFGSAVTIGAPGEGVIGVNIDGPGYAYFSGTSYATALVSGAVALIKWLNPKLLPTDIIKILKATGSDPVTRRGYLVCDGPGTSPCPVNQRWPVLDAGAAVLEVIPVLVSARVNSHLSRRYYLGTASPIREVDWYINVSNTGSVDWRFYMDGSIQSPYRTHPVNLQALEIPAGGSGEFKLTARDNSDGRWTANVNLYRDLHMASPVATDVQLEITFANPHPNETRTPIPELPAFETATPTPAPTPTATVTPTPRPTPTPTPALNPVAASTQAPTPTARPTPSASPVPTATSTPVPTSTPTPLPTRTPKPTSTPSPTPTTPPRVPEAPSGLTQFEYQLLRDVYDCGQQSTAFKWAVISIDSFANLVGYRTSITEGIMDNWDLFLPAFTELLYGDSGAADTLVGMVELFCSRN